MRRVVCPRACAILTGGAVIVVEVSSVESMARFARRVMGRPVIVRRTPAGYLVCLVDARGVRVPLHVTPVSARMADTYKTRVESYADELRDLLSCGFFSPEHARRIVASIGTAIMYGEKIDPRAVHVFCTWDGSEVIADALWGVVSVPEQVRAVELASRVVLGQARHVFY